LEANRVDAYLQSAKVITFSYVFRKSFKKKDEIHFQININRKLTQEPFKGHISRKVKMKADSRLVFIFPQRLLILGRGKKSK
jgi:hypothetical protein